MKLHRALGQSQPHKPDERSYALRAESDSQPHVIHFTDRGYFTGTIDLLSKNLHTMSSPMEHAIMTLKYIKGTLDKMGQRELAQQLEQSLAFLSGSSKRNTWDPQVSVASLMTRH